LTPTEKVCAKCGGDPQPIGNFPVRKRSRRIRGTKAREVVLGADSWCYDCRRAFDKKRKPSRKRIRSAN
jgi:hypothetical protein